MKAGHTNIRYKVINSVPDKSHPSEVQSKLCIMTQVVEPKQTVTQRCSTVAVGMTAIVYGAMGYVKCYLSFYGLERDM